MDTDFQNYHWDSPGNDKSDETQLIDDLFFGLKTNCPSDWKDSSCEFKNTTERTRKVTITEITEEGVNQDDEEWDEAENEDGERVESDEEAVVETEEVFQLLDDVVQDWKIKLECVVGDGLKKLRKAGKEKKLMVKYLPGEHAEINRKLGSAKATIMKDWKTDFNHILNGIQRKLDKLSKDKINEVDSLYNDKFLYKNTNVKNIEDLNKNKKQVVNIDCREKKTREGGSCYIELKQLIRELNKMCERVASTNNLMTENVVPVYNMYNDSHNNMPETVVANQYETPLNQYLRHLQSMPPPNPTPNFTTKIDPEVIAKNQANILDALDDFRIKQSKQNKVLKIKIKENRRDTNTFAAQRKMLQRKVNKRGVALKTNKRARNEAMYSYRMRHYNRDGKDHYLIVRKPELAENLNVEDIFEDWRCIAMDDHDDRKRQRTPRVRKLSHKAQRKAMLKEPSEGPMLYADALKKNLKYRPDNAPVEDIFEAWRDYLQELDDLLSSSLSSSLASSRHPSGNDEDEIKIKNAKEEKISESSENILETAVVYPKELQSCGQPTVRTVPYELHSSDDSIKDAAVKSFSIAVTDCNAPVKDPNEAPFADTRSKKLDAKKKRKTIKYQPEIYFAGWRHNFADAPGFYPSSKIRQMNKKQQYQPEEYFRVWKRNFFVRETSELTDERKRRQMQPKMMPEKIFNEWLHNFHRKHRHDSQNKYGSLKRHNSKKARKGTPEKTETSQKYENEDMDMTNSLKNKSRSSRQRRSKKKKE